MGVQDDHVATFGDWPIPSPSPRTFFSGMLHDEISSRSIIEDRNDMLLPGTSEGFISGRIDEIDGSRGGIASGEFTKSDIFSEQKMNSRGGLLERMAARAGFNAPRLNMESFKSAGHLQNQDFRSPYLTIPPGLSPTTLLESPVFLSNPMVQPSPTTGKFPFVLGGSNTRNSTLASEALDKNKDSFYGDISTSSFAFKPVPESGPPPFRGAARENFPSFGVSAQPESSIHSHKGSTLHLQDFSRPYAEKDTDSRPIVASTENSPPLDDQQDDEGNQPSGGDTLPGGAPAEDGYNWRKYGQKQVKGSEYPRSYYKCTHPNCPVKKKVERSHEGHITEIIYKGAHNHPKPPPNRRSAVGSSNLLSDMQIDLADQAGPPDWRHDNLEVTSSPSVGAENCNGPNSLQVQNGTPFESGDVVDRSSTFSNDENEDEDDRVTHGSVSLGYDGEEDESESKRRKIEAYATEMSGATRAIREPRVVVQTTSEVDILDDGYRWRKYGQKVVKGNPNPRSYYKCTHTGCTVRKHVERASHDLKSVITTYEGKHNHEVPAARNSSHLNSGNPSNGPAQSGPTVPAHLQRPEPAQIHNGRMARFDRTPAISSFGRQQFGPSHGFSFGMSHPGLANLAMAGLGPDRSRLPVHPYMGQQQNFNEMGFPLPKGEPKVEPLSEPPSNLSNGASIYHQIMSRMPLGP